MRLATACAGCVLGALVAFGVLTPRPVRAGAPVLSGTSYVFADQVLGTGISFEPSPVVQASYTRRGLFRLGSGEVDAGGRLDLPLFLLPGLDEARLTAGLSGRIARLTAAGDAASMSWLNLLELAYGAGLFWQTGADDMARSHAFGFEAGIAMRYRPMWGYLGLATRVRASAFTHIGLRPYARFLFEERYNNNAPGAPLPPGAVTGPRSGWYGWTSARILMGVESGITLAPGVWLTLAGGSWWSPQAQGLWFTLDGGQLPLFVDAGVLLAL